MRGNRVNDSIGRSFRGQSRCLFVSGATLLLFVLGGVMLFLTFSGVALQSRIDLLLRRRSKSFLRKLFR